MTTESGQKLVPVWHEDDEPPSLEATTTAQDDNAHPMDGTADGDTSTTDLYGTDGQATNAHDVLSSS